MYLKRLEIQGFKSFAHKTVLEFEPGLTAVVGPNGSGKSNVADALRWVMGEQSMKTLRGKKSEDVIFAGSDKKSKLSLAEVVLTFDNKDRKLPYEYAEVAVTRRFFRNGESEYLINNQKARLLDVVEALMRSGFGATNYAVIGQGTIDQMVLAGPAEIKNLIEEAAGVKPYYIKREKTWRKLEQTEENLQRVSELTAEIEPRLRSLRRQAKRMEEREQVASQYKEAVTQYYGHQYFLLNNELKAITEKLNSRSEVVQALEKEIQSFESILEKEEKQSTRSNSFLDEMDNKYKSLEDQKLSILEKLAEIKGKLKAELPATQDFTKFEKEFQEIIDSINANNFEEIKQKLKQLVSSYGKSSNDDLIKQKKELDEKLEHIVKEIQEHNNAKAKLLAEEKQKKSFLTEEEKKYRSKTTELSRMKDEQNSILVEKARVETRFESMLLLSKEAIGTPVTEGNMVEKVEADLNDKLAKLKRQLELSGSVDETTLQEFKETEERFNYLTGQHEDLSKGVTDLKSVIDELDQVIKNQFNEAYTKISEKFVEYFKILFNGGKAQMTLQRSAVNSEGEEEESVFDEAQPDGEPKSGIDGVKHKKPQMEISGIEIKATPPGKKLASIAALSGGERALTAIALLCSMLAAYPSPFVVLDEVDAALDEANSIRFGKILGTLAHQTQFITITHNRETMRQAHTLYGVTMTDEGISKILSLRLEQAEKIAPVQ